MADGVPPRRIQFLGWNGQGLRRGRGEKEGLFVVLVGRGKISTKLKKSAKSGRCFQRFIVYCTLVCRGEGPPPCVSFSGGIRSPWPGTELPRRVRVNIRARRRIRENDVTNEGLRQIRKCHVRSGSLVPTQLYHTSTYSTLVMHRVPLVYHIIIFTGRE